MVHLNDFGFTLDKIMEELNTGDLNDKEKGILRLIIEATLELKPKNISELTGQVKGAITRAPVKRVLESLDKRIRELKSPKLTEGKYKSIQSFPLLYNMYSRIRIRKNAKYFLPEHKELIDLIWSHRNDVIASLIKTRDRGITAENLKEKLDITRTTANRWLKRGLLEGKLDLTKTKEQHPKYFYHIKGKIKR